MRPARRIFGLFFHFLGGSLPTILSEAQAALNVRYVRTSYLYFITSKIGVNIDFVYFLWSDLCFSLFGLFGFLENVSRKNARRENPLYTSGFWY